MNAMKLIIIDRKAWERHCPDFTDLIHRIEQLIGNPPEADEWLDNEASRMSQARHQQAHPAILSGHRQDLFLYHWA